MAYTTIDDPSAHYQTQLYTGNGSTQSITNGGNSDLQPDLIWIKSRSDSSFNALTDSSRGTSKRLYSNSDATEETHSDRVTAFNSDGFSLGSSSLVNTNTYNYVGWQWKANGGTTSTNSDGDINSTVQADTTAGFSIVQYNPSNTTARSIGHGLGVQPQVVIVRARDRQENWRVFHRSAGTTGALTLDGTAAYNSNTVLFAADSTSTVFKVGTDYSVNGAYNYIAYCFADVQGYSKFSKYIGNGNANGPFVYTGFKPAWVLIKQITDAAGDDWILYDNKREPENVAIKKLFPNQAASESSSYDTIDMLSNGFKTRTSLGGTNSSGKTYVYMAFAENPFVTSDDGGSIPTTAR